MYTPLKPYALISYILSLLVYFLIGLFLAELLGVGKDQGLAGSGSLLLFGMVSSLIGLITSFFLAIKLNRSSIITINKTLLMIFLVLAVIIFYRYNSKINPQQENSTIIVQPK